MVSDAKQPHVFMQERNNSHHELHCVLCIFSSNLVLYKLLNGDNNLSQTNGAYKMAGMYILILVLSPCMECCRDVTCVRISLDREESIGRKFKGTTMAHWDDRLQKAAS